MRPPLPCKLPAWTADGQPVDLSKKTRQAKKKVSMLSERVDHLLEIAGSKMTLEKAIADVRKERAVALAGFDAILAILDSPFAPGAVERALTATNFQAVTWDKTAANAAHCMLWDIEEGLAIESHGGGPVPECPNFCGAPVAKGHTLCAHCERKNAREAA